MKTTIETLPITAKDGKTRIKYIQQTTTNVYFTN